MPDARRHAANSFPKHELKKPAAVRQEAGSSRHVHDLERTCSVAFSLLKHRMRRNTTLRWFVRDESPPPPRRLLAEIAEMFRHIYRVFHQRCPAARQQF